MALRKVLLIGSNGLIEELPVADGLYVALISGLGAGGNLILQSTDNATKGKIFFGSSQVSAFDETNNWLGLGTAAPTHPLTIPSGTNGIALYNTSDIITNYERFVIRFNGNILYMGVETGGTGTTFRDIIVGRTIGEGMIVRAGNNASGRLNANYNNTGSGAVFATTGTVIGTTDVVNLLAGLNTINQSSAGGYRGLYLSPYEQAVGSTRELINVGTNTAAANGGTHTSVFLVDATGKIISSQGGQWYSYNTAGQGAAAEFLRMYWNANVFNILTDKGTTGTRRAINIGASNVTINADTNQVTNAVATGINATPGTATTTTATPATIQTIAIPAGGTKINATILAKRTGGTSATGTTGEVASYAVSMLVQNKTGTLAIVGTPNWEIFETSGATAYDVSATPSGTSIILQVIGAAATNVSWQVSDINVKSI